MFSIHTNIANLNAHLYHKKQQKVYEDTTNQLSSGNRINNAVDDSAGLSISSRLESKIRGIEVAKRNIQDGISIVQRLDNAAESYTNTLIRIRDIAIQASNGTNSIEDVELLNKEYTKLYEEFTKIAENTEFNKMKIMDGSLTTIKIHTSEIYDDTIDITLKDFNVSAIGVSDTLDNASSILSPSNPSDNIRIIDSAIEDISIFRSNLGALNNRLNFTLDNLSSKQISASQANSRIKDSDMAKASSEFVKATMLSFGALNIIDQSYQNQKTILNLMET